MSWNEISRRYVDSPPEFYFPSEWRRRSDDKKQGSGGPLDGQIQSHLRYSVAPRLSGYLQGAYESLIAQGVAPEQARMILPQNTFTEWHWSGSLQAWAHMCNLRCKDDTQQETREIAQQIDNEMATLFPHSWKALRT